MEDQNSAHVPPANTSPPVGIPPVVEIVPPQADPPQTPPSGKFSLSPKIMLIILAILIVAVIGSGMYLSSGTQPKPTPTPTPTIVSKPTPTPDPTANWKTYTNTKIGYQIKFPDRYSGPRISNSPPILAIGDEDEAAIIFGDTEMDSYILNVSSFSGTLQELKAKKNTGDRLGGLVGSSDISTTEEDVEINNKNFLIIASILKIPQLPISNTYRSAFFLGQNRGFVLRASPKFDKTTFLQILSTFKFTES